MTRIFALKHVFAIRALGDVAIAQRDDLVIRHARARLVRREIAALPMLKQFVPRKRAQLDVGAAARHIGGDHHARKIACTEHDFSFTLVLLCVEHFMANLMLRRQHARDHLALLNTSGSDEHRATNIVIRLDFLADRVPLIFLRQIHAVLSIIARDRHIGRNRHDIEFVDLVKLFGFRISGARHA